jgi:predicted nucleotidyltransferase
MLAKNLTILQVKIVDFCRKHQIHRLALFCSALGENFNMQSNVDVLVEFEDGHVAGFAFFDLQDGLPVLLGARLISTRLS